MRKLLIIYLISNLPKSFTQKKEEEAQFENFLFLFGQIEDVQN